ncbi:MAG: hypothetical protein ACK5QU_03340, partial [Bacteroidota bacterium]
MIETFANETQTTIAMMTFNLLSLLNNINNKHYHLYHTMKNLSFEAKFNLKSEPNELIVEGSITTERPDDELIIEVSSDTSYIETMLLLEIKLKQGNGPMQDHRKTFIYKLNNTNTKHFTNVKINYGNGE